jgi:hypothetical protein
VKSAIITGRIVYGQVIENNVRACLHYAMIYIMSLIKFIISPIQSAKSYIQIELSAIANHLTYRQNFLYKGDISIPCR